MSAFDIENSIGFLLSKAYQSIFANLREALEPFGVTPPQFALLAFLWKEDGLSQTEISERAEVDRTTLGGIIDRLEKMSLVRRAPNPADRRVSLVLLTPAGQKLEETLVPLAVEVRKRFTSNLAANEYDQLCVLLNKLRR